MSFLLKSEVESGSIGFSPERIAGMLIEARTYQIKDGLVEIGHEFPDVAQADAEHLLASGRYMLASPSEQETFVKAKGKGSSIQEDSPKDKKSMGG